MSPLLVKILLIGAIGSPALAAAALGLSAWLDRRPGERAVYQLSRAALGLSLLNLLLLGLARLGGLPAAVDAGPWLEAATYRVHLDFLIDGPGLALAASAVASSLVALRFALHYLHREAGFLRFYALTLLFAAGTALVALGGNLMLTLLGWEVVGLTSALLIGWSLDRPLAQRGSRRALLTNRVGDAGLLGALVVAQVHLGSVRWEDLLSRPSDLGDGGAAALLGGLAAAALAKSGQWPFTPWIHRAMEGPTPSSALFYGGAMVLLGPWLIVRSAPVWHAFPLASAIFGAIALGGAAAVAWAARAQPDVKSGLVLRGVAWSGVSTALALVSPTVGLLHLLGAGWTRQGLLLQAPSALRLNDQAPSRRGPSASARAHAWALQVLYLEDLHQRAVVRPLLQLAQAAEALDARWIERASGLPAPIARALASLQGFQEQPVEARAIRAGQPPLGAINAFAEQGAAWTSEAERVGEDLLTRFPRALGRLGRGASEWDHQLARPLVPALIIAATLLFSLLELW